jgi:hypothetical protein
MTCSRVNFNLYKSSEVLERNHGTFTAEICCMEQGVLMAFKLDSQPQLVFLLRRYNS